MGTFCTGKERTGAVSAQGKMLPGTGKRATPAFALDLPEDMAALALTGKASSRCP